MKQSRASSRPHASLPVSTGEFYPPLEPYDVFQLSVGQGHSLYVEQSGNPNGVPVVVLHGGPGASTSPLMRQLFNPARYRIILFDQRGAGKSTPHASLNGNTTWHLVRDIETLRSHIKIKKWHVLGGSWGSTLALAYAIQHPQRVRSLTMRGIFLGRKLEIDWIFRGGASIVFPDYWEKFLALVAPEDRADPVAAYHKMLTGDDEQLVLKAATAWAQWETVLTRILISDTALASFLNPTNALPFSRIECHYFINGCFLPSESWVFENIHRIRHIPSAVIQGRYDMNCPMQTAMDLVKVWPECQLIVVPDAGHSGAEPGIRRALINATDAFSQLPPGSTLRRYIN